MAPLHNISTLFCFLFVLSYRWIDPIALSLGFIYRTALLYLDIRHSTIYRSPVNLHPTHAKANAGYKQGLLQDN